MVISHVHRSFIQNKPTFTEYSLTQWISNSLCKAVHNKFHGFGGLNKHNCSQDQANIHTSWAWQIVLIYHWNSISGVAIVFQINVYTRLSHLYSYIYIYFKIRVKWIFQELKEFFFFWKMLWTLWKIWWIDSSRCSKETAKHRAIHKNVMGVFTCMLHFKLVLHTHTYSE